MAQCRGCGTQLPDGARFCLECGRPLASTCTGCDAPLPPQAKFCMECGTPSGPSAARASPAEPTGASSRRTTSILFGDLVGFTTLSESRDAEDVRELLSRYFDECRQIITRYGGTVEKFIGDAVMAVWGVPTAHEDDAERAVRAGLELVAAVNDFGHDVGAPVLALRVGVVTGEVAVTTGATQQGMVAGDAVNTAARVQSAAAPGQVWVDETTRLLTAAAITYADAGSHALKGKVDPVPLWSVRAVVAAVGGAQRADGLEAPLVGRDRELRLVKELFHQSEESQQPLLLVVDGEPGVGKSRLGWEFEKYVDGLNDLVLWHSGRCVAYGEGVAYFALAEAVRGRLQSLVEGDEAPEVSVMLAHALSTYVLDEAEREWLSPRLGVLLGLASVGTFPREDLFSAWVTFLERVGDGQPVTLVIDDAQHADQGLVAFLEYLLTVATFPCFVLMLARPGLLEGHPGLAANRRANIVRLPGLADRDVARLLDGLVAGLPESVRDQLVARSDGVPVFAVETVRSLIDRDLVVPRGGQYVLADPDHLDLDSLAAPASLQALIAARLDALSHSQRLCVDRASVLGQTFPPQALAALCPEVKDLDAVLAELVRLQILARDSGRMSATFGHYSFVQTAVRQVALAGLSRRDRRAIHLAVVGYFDSIGENGDDTAAIRAEHYLEAVAAVPGEDNDELRAAALTNLVRAAARSVSLGSPGEAARHLLAALDLAPDTAERARVGLELARAERDSGHIQQALDHARDAQAVFLENGDRVEAGMAAAVVGACYGEQGLIEESLAEVEPWWEELQGRDDAVESLLALSMHLMISLQALGRDFHQVLEKRLALAESTGALQELSACYNLLGIHYATQGALSLGSTLFALSADTADQHHDLHGRARALQNLAAQENPRDLTRALDYSRQAMAAAQRSGALRWIVGAEANYAVALWSSGAWSELAPLADRLGTPRSDVLTLDDATLTCVALMHQARGELSDALLDAAGGHGGADVASADLALLAWRHTLQSIAAEKGGDPALALSHGMSALHGTFATTGLWDDLTHLWGRVADLALTLGDDAALAQCLAMTDTTGKRLLPTGLRGHRAHVAARIAILAGDEAAVEPAFAEAVAAFEKWGGVPFRARAREDLAIWLLQQGRPAEAEPLLAEVRDAYEQLGARAWQAALEARTAGVGQVVTS